MEIKLKLKVRDVEIELTKDEAIKLKDMLNELTGVRIEKEWVPYYPTYPTPTYPYPWYVCTKWSDNTCNTIPISNDVQITYTLS